VGVDNILATAYISYLGESTLKIGNEGMAEIVAIYAESEVCAKAQIL
jgi:hypothetical protein